MVDHAHGIFGESASEPGEGGMIRRRLIKRKPQKLLEGIVVASEKRSLSPEDHDMKRATIFKGGI